MVYRYVTHTGKSVVNNLPWATGGTRFTDEYVDPERFDPQNAIILHSARIILKYS